MDLPAISYFRAATAHSSSTPRAAIGGRHCSTTRADLSPLLARRGPWSLLFRFRRSGPARWNNRQQDEIFLATAEMQGRLAAEDVERPIAWIVMQKRPVTGELVLHVRKPAAGSAGIHIIPAAYAQCNAI